MSKLGYREILAEIAVAMNKVSKEYKNYYSEDFEFYFDRKLNPIYGEEKEIIINLWNALSTTKALREEVRPKVFQVYSHSGLTPEKYLVIDDINNEKNWKDVFTPWNVYDHFMRLYLREELPVYCYIKNREAWRAFEKHDRRLFEAFRDERICKGSRYPIPGIKEPISHKDKEALKEAREEFDYLLNSVSDNRGDRKIKMKYAKDKIYHIIFGIK